MLRVVKPPQLNNIKSESDDLVIAHIQTPHSSHWEKI